MNNKEGIREKSSTEKFSTLDLYLASFLALNGLIPTLENKGSRVIFSFPVSQELYKIISNYNSNVNVPVADFVVALKALRSKMLTIRGESKDGHKQTE